MSINASLLPSLPSPLASHKPLLWLTVTRGSFWSYSLENPFSQPWGSNIFKDHITQEAGCRIVTANQQQAFLWHMQTVPTVALLPPPSYKFLFDCIGLQGHQTEADSHMLGRTGLGLVFRKPRKSCRYIFLAWAPTHQAYTTYHGWRSQWAVSCPRT